MAYAEYPLCGPNEGSSDALIVYGVSETQGRLIANEYMTAEECWK